MYTTGDSSCHGEGTFLPRFCTLLIQEWERGNKTKHCCDCNKAFSRYCWRKQLPPLYLSFSKGQFPGSAEHTPFQANTLALACHLTSCLIQCELLKNKTHVRGKDRWISVHSRLSGLDSEFQDSQDCPGTQWNHVLKNKTAKPAFKDDWYLARPWHISSKLGIWGFILIWTFPCHI